MHKKTKNLTLLQLKTFHHRILTFQGQEILPLPKKEEIILQGKLESINQFVFGEELYPTKCDKAVKLLMEIQSSQSFPDGNKRVALAAFEMYLKINKSTMNLEITQKQKENFVLSIATHSISNEYAINCCKEALKA